MIHRHCSTKSLHGRTIRFRASAFRRRFRWASPGIRRAAKALAKLARSSSSDPWIRTAILSSASPLRFRLVEQNLLSDQPFAASADGQAIYRPVDIHRRCRNQTSEVHRLLEQFASRDRAAIRVRRHNNCLRPWPWT